MNVKDRRVYDSRHELAEEIGGRLVRRHSNAAVLFHHAVAERLGLGSTDHKCLDLLRERGAITGSELAAITGLTSGAITGVVARLERAGYLRREPDPHDGRQQILHPSTRAAARHPGRARPNTKRCGRAAGGFRYSPAHRYRRVPGSQHGLCLPSLGLAAGSDTLRRQPDWRDRTSTTPNSAGEETQMNGRRPPVL